MNNDLKTRIAEHIEGTERTRSRCAPIDPLDKFKTLIQNDVDRAIGQIRGNLEDIIQSIGRFEEYQSEHIGDLQSAAASLIAFLCARWNIEQKKHHVH